MESRDPQLWKQAKARVGFQAHLRTYFIVNAGLWLLWLAIGLTSGRSLGYPWPVWSTLGGGIGLIAHYFGVYHWGNSGDMIEKEYRKLGGQ